MNFRSCQLKIFLDLGCTYFMIVFILIYIGYKTARKFLQQIFSVLITHYSNLIFIATDWMKLYLIHLIFLNRTSILHWLFLIGLFFFNSSPEDMLIDFREGKRGRETERNINWLLLVHTLTGVQIHNLGMHPDWESNLWLFWFIKWRSNQLSHTDQGLFNNFWGTASLPLRYLWRIV